MNKTNKGTFKKGSVPWNKGKKTGPLSKETKEKLSKFHSTQIRTEEWKNNISKSHKGIGKGKHIPKDKLKIKLTKEYITKKKNNSFNKSNTENEFYTKLLEENKNKTIYRQYKDDRYPYYCDFYVVEDDLFIELNAHWSHGGMPFDENSESCQKQLREWQEKAKTSKFYENAIVTWKVRDVEKRKCAEKNKLNYKVVY